MLGSPSTGQSASSRSILFITGPIASGKTSVADAVAKLVPGSGRSTFSSALRALAVLEGVNVSCRAQLQDFGESMATTRWRTLWDMTLRLAQPVDAPNLIIDGLRHLYIYDQLWRDAALNVGLLSVIPGPAVIEARMQARGEQTWLTAHSVESQWETLAAAAHVALRGEAAKDPDPDAVARTFRWLWR